MRYILFTLILVLPGSVYSLETTFKSHGSINQAIDMGKINFKGEIVGSVTTEIKYSHLGHGVYKYHTSFKRTGYYYTDIEETWLSIGKPKEGIGFVLVNNKLKVDNPSKVSLLNITRDTLYSSIK